MGRVVRRVLELVEEICTLRYPRSHKAGAFSNKRIPLGVPTHRYSWLNFSQSSMTTKCQLANEMHRPAAMRKVICETPRIRAIRGSSVLCDPHCASLKWVAPFVSRIVKDSISGRHGRSQAAVIVPITGPRWLPPGHLKVGGIRPRKARPSPPTFLISRTLRNSLKLLHLQQTPANPRLTIPYLSQSIVVFLFRESGTAARPESSSNLETHSSNVPLLEACPRLFSPDSPAPAAWTPPLLTITANFCVTRATQPCRDDYTRSSP